MAQPDSDIIMSHLDTESDLYITDFDSESISTKSASKTASLDIYITTPKSKLTDSKNLNKRKLSIIDSDLHPVGKRARTNEVPEADLNDFKYLEDTIDRDDQDLQRYITDEVYIDKRSRYIVGGRTFLLKDGLKLIAHDPSSIQVRSLVEIAKAYEDKSSPKEL